jgi:hypothetical protein
MDDEFPETIHVTREGEGEESYLAAYEGGLPVVDDGTPVAVYKRVTTGVVTVTRTFEPDEQ